MKSIMAAVIMLNCGTGQIEGTYHCSEWGMRTALKKPQSQVCYNKQSHRALLGHLSLDKYRSS